MQRASDSSCSNGDISVSQPPPRKRSLSSIVAGEGPITVDVLARNNLRQGKGFGLELDGENVVVGLVSWRESN